MPGVNLVSWTTTVVVNMKSTGPTLLNYGSDTDPNRGWYPIRIVFSRGLLQGTVTLQPTVSVGTNASAYDDLLGNTVLGFTSAIGGFDIYSPKALAPFSAVNPLNLNVVVAATTVSGTYNVNIDVIAFEFAHFSL